MLAAAQASGAAAGGTGTARWCRQALLSFTLICVAVCGSVLEPRAGARAVIGRRCERGRASCEPCGARRHRSATPAAHLAWTCGCCVASCRGAGACVRWPGTLATRVTGRWAPPQVDVLEADTQTAPGLSEASALAACRRVNEALLHRVATGKPFSVWKYAMTLDGKIATRSGHSAWVSGAEVLSPASHHGARTLVRS